MSPRRQTKTRNRRSSEVVKPFYLGSDKMVPAVKGQRGESFGYGHRGDWAKATIEEATEQARARLEKDRSVDEVIIVKVVRVVKRRPAPVVVEEVR